jgi:hypothetical protein
MQLKKITTDKWVFEYELNGLVSYLEIGASQKPKYLKKTGTES